MSHGKFSLIVFASVVLLLAAVIASGCMGSTVTAPVGGMHGTVHRTK
jgi:hypothetical protein